MVLGIVLVLMGIDGVDIVFFDEFCRVCLWYLIMVEFEEWLVWCVYFF